MAKKIKLALYWGATCGGCDIATLDLDEKILDLAELAEIVLWPIATDFKYKNVEAMRDNAIDITLYNGGILNEENEQIAKLLRKKSKVLFAFGTCACFGGIPGLTNVATRDETFQTVYHDTPSTVNPELVIPQTKVKINEHKLTLPEKYDTGKALNQVIEVDYYLPGCPPAVERIDDAIKIIVRYANTSELPGKGTVIANEKSLCDECEREREEKKLNKIYRPWEIEADPKKCLLDQGIICIGPATRGGCGTRCINANQPCRGCMGPLPGVKDQGAAMMSALASVLGIEEEDKHTQESVEKLIDQVKDPLGTLYRFTLPSSIIPRKFKEK